MFDVFLQKETDLEHPACGGIFSKKSQPLNREDLLFHFSENEIKDSTPIPQEIISAFTLLVNDEEGFFALCDDPQKMDRNRLEKYLQSDPEKVSHKDPLVHMKEIISRPILDLKEDEIKQPTSRVKKFASRALDYLASHSEDWRNKSFVGVHPQRLLSLVREDKWETYENRLLYTLCQILNTLINQRLHELKSVDDGYGEIQKYYEVVNNLDYNGMLYEVNKYLTNYSSEKVDKSREQLKKTIAFLEHIQMVIHSFWNSQLFRNLKRIPNIEVDINQFITTNILMNNQHYLYLPKVQKVILNSCSKALSKKEKQEEQKLLLTNEIYYVKRCIDNFKSEYNFCWDIIKPTTSINEFEIILECSNKKLRFFFATSNPSESYKHQLKNNHGNNNEISILIYPQETPYLKEEQNQKQTIDTMLSIFGRQLPQYGTYSSENSVIGISPQSVFSKLIIQRILLQWAWSLTIIKFPFELPQTKFLENFVKSKYIFKKYDESEFRKFMEQKCQSIYKKNEKIELKKAQDKEVRILQEMNQLVSTALECPCCKKFGKLSDGATILNFMITCPNCGCRWSRNNNTTKWIKGDDSKIYGKFESFEINKTP